HGAVLLARLLEPVLPSPAGAVRGFFAACACRLGEKPASALPAGGLGEAGAAIRQPIVQRRGAYAARRRRAAVGKLVGVVQPERFADAVGQIGGVAVERLAAADVDAGEIERRLAGL